MLRLAFALALLLALATLPLDVSAHSGCLYEDCHDECTEKLRQCMAKCDEGPSDKVGDCKTQCNHDNQPCIEHCDEGHHDPSC